MFLGLFGIFLFFVEWSQADVTPTRQYIQIFNATPDILHKHAAPSTYYNRFKSYRRYECTRIGRYPDPYNRQNYYTCDKVLRFFQGPRKPQYCQFPFLSGCIIPSEWCRCPPGTFWAGPSAGCINDPKEMLACSLFKPDCFNGDGGDFGECILSTLGYRYSCRRELDTAVISVEKCEKFGVARDTCLVTKNPLNLTDLPLETYKVLPVCEPFKYAFEDVYVKETKTTEVRMAEFLDVRKLERKRKISTSKSADSFSLNYFLD